MLHPARPVPSVLKAPAVPRWKRSDHDTQDNALQRFTLAWLKTLPEPARPHQCALHYPRVLNNIAALWAAPQRCLDYLDELQADRRGNRQGFGHGAAQELRRLRTRRAAMASASGRGKTGDFPATAPMAL